MFRWERRLKDLAQLLVQCESTYFDPELFRMNTNQFLQTSRTVTFLIQKTKSEIPDYDNWYKKNIIDAWSGDTLMTWAKDSRNTIEKERDLDMYSSLSATLFFSYITAEDISIPCGRTELLGANVTRLKRFARSSLPSYVSDAAVIRTERTWVANTLPDWELLQAFKYIYSRLHTCCKELAIHLGASLNPDIRHPADANTNNPRETIYFKLNSKSSSIVRHKIIPFDSSIVADNVLAEINQNSAAPKNLHELVELHAKYSQAIFKKRGCHIPICFLFDASNKPIDLISTSFDDQADKYIFWRSVADRILYLKPSSILWIAEAWLRDGRNLDIHPIRKLPIAGEFLEVVALNVSGELRRVTRLIHRNEATGEVTLEDQSLDIHKSQEIPNFFLPAFDALQLAHHRKN